MIDPAGKRLGRESTISTEFGSITLNWNHPPQRLLSYFFDNVVRHYEQTELGRYIREHGRPGYTFIDVGANLGIYSLLAKRAGMKSILFEPEPSHSAFLQANTKVFGAVFAIALSDAIGDLPLYYEAGNPGATSLFASANCIKSPGTVPVRTFSDVAAEGGLGDLSKIALIKIDVEGFEAFTVAGMRDFLASGQRPHIWCEVRGDKSGRNGGSYRQVREVLAEYNYKAHKIKNGQDVPLIEKKLAESQVLDLLFTPCT
jgi:FkbM family methyltransferase